MKSDICGYFKNMSPEDKKRCYFIENTKKSVDLHIINKVIKKKECEWEKIKEDK